MDKNHQSPDGNAGKAPTDAKAKENPANTFFQFIRGWPFIGSFALVIGGGIWSVIGDSVFGKALLVLGLCCVFFLAAHRLWENWLLRYGIPLLLSCGAVATALMIANKMAANKGPELQFVLHSPRFPQFSLVLTNKGLFQDSKADILYPRWILVIPVTSKDAEATLRLSVRNISETETLNGFEANVTFSEDLEVSPASIVPAGPWQFADSLPNCRSFTSRDRDPLYPLTPKLLTDIGLKQKGGWPNPPSEKRLLLLLRGDRMIPVAIAMRLVCPVFNVPQEPYLVPEGGTYKIETGPKGAGTFGPLP